MSRSLASRSGGTPCRRKFTQIDPSAASPRRAAAGGLRRRITDHPVFLLPRDFTLFLHGARTDNAIKRALASLGARAAFEEAYTRSPDPWFSAAPRYRYQERKYEQLMSLLPDRHFEHALDLGCGLGLLTRRLAGRAHHVLGVDIADAALVHARRLAADLDNVVFGQGDVLDLPAGLDGSFDLVVIADTLYYLDPLHDDMLKALSTRIAALLRPGGVCVLANHFFFAADAESRVSRRIHDAFAWSPRFRVLAHHRRAFFLVTLLSGRQCGPTPALDGMI